MFTLTTNFAEVVGPSKLCTLNKQLWLTSCLKLTVSILVRSLCQMAETQKEYKTKLFYHWLHQTIPLLPANHWTRNPATPWALPRRPRASYWTPVCSARLSRASSPLWHLPLNGCMCMCKLSRNSTFFSEDESSMFLFLFYLLFL